MRISLFALCLLAAGIPAFGQLLTQDSHLIAQGFDGAPGNRERGDVFGRELAAGDFDGDGFMDLAVAAIGDPDGRNRGIVTVFPGGPFGLIPEAAVDFLQGAGGLDGDDENNDFFGFALAASDFDNDGFYDLAVGVPGEDGGRGIVQVLYGSENGLNGDRDQVWDQGDLAGSGRDASDQFGYSLTAGDFNGDGFADLAVGSIGEASFAGVIHAIYGSASGLTANGNQRWRQDADGIEGNREQGDQFGFELTAGDFNGDGADDLAVGVIGEDNGDGGVAVIFGSQGGLVSAGNVFLRQGDNGIPDRREREDAFGYVLAAGDFNGDGFDELAATSLGEDNARGMVIVLPGSSGGLTGSGSVDWRQGQRGLQDAQENGDLFGTSLAVGDFDADGFHDLAVGVRGEDGNRGIVQVIYGSASGLAADGNQLFQEGFEGLAGEARPSDDFGNALAVGNFGFDAAQDLAVGAPNEENGEGRGTAYLIYGDGLLAVSAGLSDPLVTQASYNAILTVFGKNFARPGTAALGGLVNGRLETNVGGVCVEMDGQRAPIFATFPGQVNFQVFVAPDQRRVVATVISNCDTPSARRSLPIPLVVASAAPELFFFSNVQKGPVAAIENNTGELLGAPGLIPGATFRKARAGDVVTVFVTGLGDTSPRFAPGELPATAGATVLPVTVELGGRTFQPAYAGVTPGNAGLYQVSFVLDVGTPSGDLAFKVTVGAGNGAVSTPPGAYLSVE